MTRGAHRELWGRQDIQLAWMVLARVTLTLQRHVKLHVRTMLFYTHVHFFRVPICESSSTTLYFTDAGSLSPSLELSHQLL